MSQTIRLSNPRIAQGYIETYEATILIVVPDPAGTTPAAHTVVGHAPNRASAFGQLQRIVDPNALAIDLRDGSGMQRGRNGRPAAGWAALGLSCPDVSLPGAAAATRPADRPRFIAIEGPDGAGKSRLVEAMRAVVSDGVEVVFTHEPQDRETAAILARHCTRPRDLENFFTEDRKRHHAEVIDSASTTVITDRYYLSTAVCQYDLPNDRVGCFVRQRDIFGEPDVWVVLMADPEVAQSRREVDDLETAPAATSQDYLETLVGSEPKAAVVALPMNEDADLDAAIRILSALI